MAQSFKFFTAGSMRKMTVQAVTSEVAGREIEFALDNNLDTYWKATSTATQDIEMDFGENVTVEAYAVFIKNYTASFGSGSTEMYYSDNGSSWTFWTGSSILLSDVTSNGVLLKDIGGSETHRYFRLRFTTISVIPECGQIFLCIRHEVDNGNIYPELNDKHYAIKKQLAPGGRTLKRQINRIPIETFGRTWLLSGDTDRDALEAMWDDAGGHGLPLVMQEDSGDARIVEIIAPEKFNANKIQHQLYRPTITFRTLPYIEDGENF